MRLLAIVFILFGSFAHADATKGQDENPLQAQGQLVPIAISPGQGAELRIKLHLPSGYRAYAEMFKLTTPEGSSFHLGPAKIAPLHDFFDETSKKKKSGVIKEAVLTAAVEAPSNLQDESSPLRLKLTYQACTKTYCLFPTTVEVPVEFTPVIAKLEEKRVDAPVPEKSAGVLDEKNLAFSFLMIFIAGILTSLTPCVFPMIPITLAVLGREAHARGRLQNFLVSLVYVLGIAITYSLLGVFAASTGALFGSFMSSPYVLGFVCLVFLAMSLSMFGLYDIQLPQSLQSKLGHAHFHGMTGAFLTGTVAGFVAAPCVGPVLVGILTFIAQTKNMWLGFWALFVFALGMGLLFLALGLFSSATKFLPKSGSWMEGVKHFFGLLMLFGFYYYLQLLLPRATFEIAVGIGAILLGSLKGAFEKDLTTPWKKIRKGICQGLLLIGVLIVASRILNFFSPASFESKVERPITEQSVRATAWQPYTETALAKAKQDRKPVMLDFAAEWCAACKELEQYTFTDEKFIEESKDFVLLKFDATNDSPELEQLKKRYGIIGLPTVLMFDRQGSWRQDLSIIAFEKAEVVVPKMQKLK